MPIISNEMKRAVKKAEHDQKKKKEAEEHRLREEQAQKEKEEREAKEKIEEENKQKHNERKIKRKEKADKEKAEKKELERRANMRKELAFLKKTTAAKEIKDEDLLERNGFTLIKKEVGTGSHSKAYKGKQADNENIVCKVILLDKCPQKYRENLMEIALKIMRFVGSGAEGGLPKHPNFVKVFEIFATDKKVYIFMDECQTLSIKERLKSGDPITEDDAKRWGKQVASALNCLHSMGVSHSNIRAENVIYDKENVIKVVGFGKASIYWDSDMEQVITKPKISLKDKNELEKNDHMPYEAFKSDTYDPSMADIWSLGVLLCQMIAKENPFKVKGEQSFEDQWRVFAQSHQFSDEAKQLLDRIFVGEISTRVKIDQLLQDPFFKSAS